VAGRCCRGQRIFCCNRGQRCGCGRTFSIFLAEVLPRHTVSASLLWQVLCRLLTDASVKAGAEALRLPFALETLYHLLRRFRLRLPELLSRLGSQEQVAKSSQTDPLLQSIEHLQSVFAQEGCPLIQFQIQFQTSLLG
jgi:hypothetical protein